MTSVLANARWEVVRLLRSRRLYLLVIPPVAGPIGSALAILDFGPLAPHGAPLVHPTALVLGLFIVGGLASMVVLDLAALTVGEDLGRRAHLTAFSLPQARWEVLAGRFLVVMGAGLGAFVVGALLTWGLAGALVPPRSDDGYGLFDPTHLLEAMLALLFFLGAVTTQASVIARSASEALVAGVLAGVTVAGVAGYLLLQQQLTMELPAVLAGGGAIGLAWTFLRFERLES